MVFHSVPLIDNNYDVYMYIFIMHKGLFPYYIISYNKQGVFQMIIEDYNKGPRVVRKDYVL